MKGSGRADHVAFGPAEVELLGSQTDLMGCLIDDLRLLSLADAGRLTLEPTEVDAGPGLARAVAAVRPGLEAKGVRIGVRDRGGGVPADELDTIFERFVQGRAAATRGAPAALASVSRSSGRWSACTAAR